MADPVAMAFEATRRRREKIVCAGNPAADRDILVRLTIERPPAFADEVAVRGRIELVPDRLIIAPGGLADYLEALAEQSFASAEARAAMMFDDLNNQIIPRWLSLTLSDGERTVSLQDRQPNWSNDTLLADLSA